MNCRLFQICRFVDLRIYRNRSTDLQICRFTVYDLVVLSIDKLIPANAKLLISFLYYWWISCGCAKRVLLEMAFLFVLSVLSLSRFPKWDSTPMNIIYLPLLIAQSLFSFFFLVFISLSLELYFCINCLLFSFFSQRARQLISLYVSCIFFYYFFFLFA